MFNNRDERIYKSDNTSTSLTLGKYQNSTNHLSLNMPGIKLI